MFEFLNSHFLPFFGVRTPSLPPAPVLFLNAGDLLPADALFIDGVECKCDEAAVYRAFQHLWVSGQHTIHVCVCMPISPPLPIPAFLSYFWSPIFFLSEAGLSRVARKTLAVTGESEVVDKDAIQGPYIVILHTNGYLLAAFKESCFAGIFSSPNLLVNKGRVL